MNETHLLTAISGLRETITTEGVWRIRRAPKTQFIEVFKVEEVGHGNIITDEFMNWRIKLSLRGDITDAPAGDGGAGASVINSFGQGGKAEGEGAATTTMKHE